MKHRVLALTLALLVGAAVSGVMRTRAAAEEAVPGSAPHAPLPISIIRLIAAPEAYHGKHVRVHGFVRIEHEGTAVYFHREDYQQGLTRNGLWLGGVNDSAAPGSREAAVAGRYALIEGRFDARHSGHMGLWSGSIQDVSRMQAWQAPAPGPGDRPSAE